MRKMKVPTTRCVLITLVIVSGVLSVFEFAVVPLVDSRERLQAARPGADLVRFDEPASGSDTSLFEAAINNDTEMILEVLSAGADINAKFNIELSAAPRRYVTSVRRTALMAAAVRGHLEVVKLLIEKGADVNAVNSPYRTTALIYAAENGHYPIVTHLVEHGANLNASPISGQTALIEAAKNGHLAIVQYLVENGAKIDASKSYSEGSAVLVAGKNRYWDVVKYLIENGADSNVVPEYQDGIITQAVYQGDSAAVRMLLDLGVDVNQSHSLVRAAERGFIEIVKMLVERGAVMEETSKWRNSSCYSALAGAIHYGHYDVARFLLTNGSKIEWVAPQLLYFADGWNRWEVDKIKYLVENGVDINYSEGRTVLIMAAIRGDMEMIKYLIAHGADVDQCVSERSALSAASTLEVAKCLLQCGATPAGPAGDNALLLACRAGDYDLVRNLMERGASVNLSNYRDRTSSTETPLMCAVRSGRLDLVKYLVESGADLAVRVDRDPHDTSGGTALEIARHEGRNEIADYLSSVSQGR